MRQRKRGGNNYEKEARCGMVPGQRIAQDETISVRKRWLAKLSQEENVFSVSQYCVGFSEHDQIWSDMIHPLPILPRCIASAIEAVVVSDCIIKPIFS
jgi:hypothetical protein